MILGCFCSLPRHVGVTWANVMEFGQKQKQKKKNKKRCCLPIIKKLNYQKIKIKCAKKAKGLSVQITLKKYVKGCTFLFPHFLAVLEKVMRKLFTNFMSLRILCAFIPISLP